jgi:hypothetical protein
VGGAVARVSLADSPLARLHGSYEDDPRPWKAILISLLVVVLLGLAIGARVTFALIAPHTVIPVPGVLSTEKRAELDNELDYNRPFDRDQAIEVALDFTARALTISPTHTTSLDFGTQKRKGNSSEYAALFVVVFEAAAKRALSSARAWRVRSGVRIFNKPVPTVSDHEWIVVHDPADGARIYIDPMLYDTWLSSNVTYNVKLAGGAPIALPDDPPK